MIKNDFVGATDTVGGTSNIRHRLRALSFICTSQFNSYEDDRTVLERRQNSSIELAANKQCYDGEIGEDTDLISKREIELILGLIFLMPHLFGIIP